MFVTQELLGGNDEVDLTKFTDELWKNIKDKYKAKLEVFIIYIYFLTLLEMIANQISLI